MRVICPHCQKTVSLADSVAGQSTPCPQCAQLFTAPALLTAEAPHAASPPSQPTPYTVQPPTPTPPMPAPVSAPAATPSSSPPPAAPPPPPPTPGVRRIQLSKKKLHWVGPVALFVLFVASFFTWVGSYAGSNKVYSQSAWGVFAGTFSTDPIGEKVLGKEDDLHKNSSAGMSMVLVLILLVLFLPIAILDLAQGYVNFAVPDIVQTIWPKRLAILFLVTGVIVLFLALQMVSSMGLESAAQSAATAKVTPAKAEEAAKVEANSALKLERELKQGEEFNRYGLRRGYGLCVGFWASLVALIGFGLEYWLERRGNRTPPAVEFSW